MHVLHTTKGREAALHIIGGAVVGHGGARVNHCTLCTALQLMSNSVRSAITRRPSSFSSLSSNANGQECRLAVVSLSSSQVPAIEMSSHDCLTNTHLKHDANNKSEDIGDTQRRCKDVRL